LGPAITCSICDRLPMLDSGEFRYITLDITDWAIDSLSQRLSGLTFGVGKGPDWARHDCERGTTALVHFDEDNVKYASNERNETGTLAGTCHVHCARESVFKQNYLEQTKS